MKISFPASGPTDTIIVPDPEFRDQGLLKIGTTFKRMIDGTIVPFQHLPPQEEISLVFNRLKYKKAREFVDFLLKGNNQTMLFESDTGTSGEFLDRGSIKGTVITDPLSLITQNNKYKNIAIIIATQETISLQPKHIGGVLGNQDKFGDCTSFYVISSDLAGSVANTDEYARFRDLDGVWSRREPQPNPASGLALGFTINDIIYVATGEDSNIPVDRTHRYEPFFDSNGFWSELSATTSVARSGGVGFSLNQKGYAVGGVSVDSLLISCIEEFTGEPTGVWSVLSSQICLGIKNAFSFTLRTKGYVGGGNIGSVTGGLRSFDGSVWSQVLDDTSIALESGRAGGDLALSKGVIFGGITPSTSLTDITVIFDELLGTLTTSSSVLPTAVADHTSASLGDAIYSATGHSAGMILDENNEYTILTNAWVARLPSLPTDRNLAISPCSNLGGTFPPEDLVLPPPLDPTPTSVVVCGGNDGTGVTRNETYKWDFGTVTANVLWDMPSNRTLHQMGSIANSVFVIDGDESEKSVTNRESFWEFDANDVWVNRSLKGDFYDGQPRDSSTRLIRSRGTCDSFEKSLYLLGGIKQQPFTSADLVNSIDRWNSIEGWRANLLSVSSSKQSYSHASAILLRSITIVDSGSTFQGVLSGVIFYIGGLRRVSTIIPLLTTTNAVTAYAIAENVLVNRTGFVSNNSGLGCLNINGELYAFTGFLTGVVTQLTSLYSANLDSWSAITVNTPQVTDVYNYAYSNTSDTDKGANFGGIDVAGTRTNTIQTYDVITKDWAVDGGSFPVATTEMRSASIANTLTPSATKKMLVTHGYKTINLRAETYTFDPTTLEFVFYPSWGKAIIFGVMETVSTLSYVIGKITAYVSPDIEDDYSTISFDNVGLSWVLKHLKNLGVDTVRAGGCSGVIGTRILIAGGVQMNTDGAGLDPRFFNRDIREYDTLTDIYSVASIPDVFITGYKMSGTVVGTDFYTFGGRGYTLNSNSQLFLGASVHHAKTDASILGPGTTVEPFPVSIKEWREGCVYENFDASTNIIIAGGDNQNYSRIQSVYHFDVNVHSYSIFTSSPKLIEITGQNIDGNIFVSSGKLGITHSDPLGSGSPEEFKPDSTVYRYSPTSKEFTALATIAHGDGVASDGSGRASSSF